MPGGLKGGEGGGGVVGEGGEGGCDGGSIGGSAGGGVGGCEGGGGRGGGGNGCIGHTWPARHTRCLMPPCDSPVGYAVGLPDVDQYAHPKYAPAEYV